MSKLEFYDVTLRDGAQSEFISFSEGDKKAILSLLEKLGLDYIEGGDPQSNPKDKEFFLSTKSGKLSAFGSTRRKDIQTELDPGLRALLEANTNTVCIYGKSSATQARDVLGVTPEENLMLIGESIAFLSGAGKRVIFDAEHFFDGFKNNKAVHKLCPNCSYKNRFNKE